MEVRISNEENLEVYLDGQKVFSHPSVPEEEPAPVLPTGVDLQWQGSFTVPLTYGQGIIAISEDGQSIFVSKDEIIGQYSIPPLGKPDNVVDLPVGNEIQPAVNILGDNYERFDPQLAQNHRFRTTGMLHKDGKLIINYCDFYDASNSAPATTLIVEDASNLATSPITGGFNINGTGRPAGALVRLQTEHQALFGGSILSFAPKESIGGRHQAGPGCVAFDTPDITFGSPALMEYPFDPVDNQLAMYYDKSVWDEFTFASEGDKRNAIWMNDKMIKADGTETLSYWTRTSKAIAGYVIPNSNTLLVAACAQGTKRAPYYTVQNPPAPTQGLVYKDYEWVYDGTQYNLSADKSGGNRQAIQDDCQTNLFLFSLSDLQKVKDGLLNPWDVRHYHLQEFKGEIPNTQRNGIHALAQGGQYDPVTDTLYITYCQEADKSRPLITAYKVNLLS